jgi:hypothetical protein
LNSGKTNQRQGFGSYLNLKEGKRAMNLARKRAAFPEEFMNSGMNCIHPSEMGLIRSDGWLITWMASSS